MAETWRWASLLPLKHKKLRQAVLYKVWADRGHVYSFLIVLLRCLYYVSSWGVTYFVNIGKDQDFWPRTDPLFPQRGCSLTTNLNRPLVVKWLGFGVAYSSRIILMMTVADSSETSIPICAAQWRTQEFCLGGVQQIQLRTEDGENGDLGAVAP